jgi:Histidine kinase-, DNA gyrase B-, and HSP90-like ATPase
MMWGWQGWSWWGWLAMSLSMVGVLGPDHLGDRGDLPRLRLERAAPRPHRRGARQPARQRPAPHPPGGHVEVTATTSLDGQAQVAVTDSGEGIPAELLERVFERFYRVDPARTYTSGSGGSGGSGIGLTITRAIVHAHGGHIRGHSHGLGHGARFVITLPTARGH